MAASGLWEIQNHTYDLHDIKDGRKGARMKTGESLSAYEKVLQDDLSKLQAKLQTTTGVAPTTFTWPYGAYTKESRDLLEELGFQATLSCRSGVNTLTKGDPESLYLLKRNIRKPGSFHRKHHGGTIVTKSSMKKQSKKGYREPFGQRLPM